MNCFKVSAQVGRQSWVKKLTIFRKIRIRREYSEDHKLIFSRTNKENQKDILCGSNLPNLIIFDYFLWKTNIPQ